MTFRRSSSRAKLSWFRGAVAMGAMGAIGTLLASRPAFAQVHWDASAQVGAAKRFVADRPTGASDASFGPTGQLAAHIALLPLVRVGAYGSYELSPTGGATRDLVSGGLRSKLLSPWPHGAVRVWLFLGVGYVGTFARAYEGEVFTSTGERVTGARVASQSGSFFEMPLGIGASYKFRKPWHLSAELGARYGFGHRGDVYEAKGVPLAGSATGAYALPGGLDRWALGLTVGLLFDR